MATPVTGRIGRTASNASAASSDSHAPWTVFSGGAGSGDDRGLGGPAPTPQATPTTHTHLHTQLVFQVNSRRYGEELLSLPTRVDLVLPGVERSRACVVSGPS